LSHSAPLLRHGRQLSSISGGQLPATILHLNEAQ
jgi:hypothetical protein